MTMLLVVTAVTAALFGYLFVDSLSYIANTGYLWCLVGFIFVIERLVDREIHEQRNLSELPPCRKKRVVNAPFSQERTMPQKRILEFLFLRRGSAGPSRWCWSFCGALLVKDLSAWSCVLLEHGFCE